MKEALFFLIGVLTGGGAIYVINKLFPQKESESVIKTKHQDLIDLLQKTKSITVALETKKVLEGFTKVINKSKI